MGVNCSKEETFDLKTNLVLRLLSTHLSAYSTAFEMSQSHLLVAHGNHRHVARS